MKEKLRKRLIHDLKLNFHRYIGQLHVYHASSEDAGQFRSQVTCVWGRHYVHAKRNDEDEPQNSGRPQTGKAWHMVSQK